jgi:cytochrome c biogenesis protein CcmG, thiol:disulfide interchange protein DsbE
MLRYLILLLIAPLFAACDGGAPKLNTGASAPAFTAARLDGSMVHFPEDLRGKPVIIRFWAEWCRYCEAEMKAIDKVYQHRRDKGLQVLAVNAGQDRETVAAFIKKIGVSYPALLDEESAIARQYGVVGLPTTYFVGADGIIKNKVVGEADEAVFDKLAGELL